MLNIRPIREIVWT